MSPRLHGLDSLRAVAILAVMLFHLQSELPEGLEPLAHFCWTGVDLFFLLSGYLIGGQLLRTQPHGRVVRLWDFYQRRLFRILPAYLVVLLLYLWVPMWRERPGLSPAWQFLSFTENLFVDYGKNQAFSHAWSLCIEEQFYLLLPLILMLMRNSTLRRVAGVLLVAVGVGIATRTYVFFHILRPLGPDDAGLAYIEHIYYPTWTRMDGLIAGVALGLVERYRPTWWQILMRRCHMCLLGGLALFAVSLWLFNDRFTSQTGAAMWGTLVGFPILAVALGLVTVSATSPNGLIARVRLPGTRSVATLAFALYLTHKEMAHLAHIWLPRWTEERDLRTALIDAGVCLAGAALLHVAVERPFLRLREWRSSRHATVDEALRLDPAL